MSDVSVPTTPTNPDDLLRQVAEHAPKVLPERIVKPLLSALAFLAKDGHDSNHQWLAGRLARGVLALPEPPAVPATQDDLREQIQRVLRERCEVEDRQYTDGTGWVLVRDDNAAQVVADYFAPVLEGLRAEIERAEDESAQLRRQVIDERVQATQTTQELFAKWRGERDQARAERAALSSLLRGMARRVGEVRDEMRFATKHVDGWRKRADRLMSQRDKARAEAERLSRPSVSDQTADLTGLAAREDQS